jgi:hypothetical protein
MVCNINCIWCNTFIKGKIKMAFSKSYGPLVISESAGVVTVALALSESVGGGSVAGSLKASVFASAELSAVQLIDAALSLAAVKYPSVALEIQGVKALVDAELASA